MNNLRQAVAIGQRGAPKREAAGSRFRHVAFWSIGLAAVVLAAPSPAHAQGNLDAGKSPARIFADTCAGCHRSARELKRTNAAYMRTHYTTGPAEAAEMANYLANVPSEPRTPPPPRQASAPPAATPGLAPDIDRPPAGLPNQPAPATPPTQSGRPPQAKAAQAPTGKKGRTDPRSSAVVVTDSRLPELPDPPPPAPALSFVSPKLEPFEE